MLVADAMRKALHKMLLAAWVSVPVFAQQPGTRGITAALDQALAGGHPDQAQTDREAEYLRAFFLSELGPESGAR